MFRLICSRETWYDLFTSSTAPTHDLIVKNQPFITLILSLLVSLSLFVGVGFAQGQPVLQLSAVQVGLFPEYIRPSVLVVLDIELAGDADEPVLLTFQIPANSDSLEVSTRTIEGESLPLAYETSEIGKWRDVRFTTAAQNILIEYYDPNLVKEGDLRLFEFQWLSIYAVEKLSLTVRQPFGAGQIQAEPPLVSSEVGPDNATYFTRQVGRVPPENCSH